MVLTKALVERGFSFPPSDFFLEILKAYGLQPHNISPNSVLAISNHVTLCEGHLRADLKLTEEGLTGKDLTLSWFTKRIQPLQHRDRLMFQYTGRDDPMRVTKDNLSADALDKRIRVLIKLEALEENELGTLLRVPSTGNTDPDAASEAEAPEASRPAKRKKAAPSSPHAKRAREVPSTAATRRAEAEKKRLSLIDTSNKGQPDVQHFFKPSG
ncbi:hypothetical protein QYE76_068512 [Lolium multiflorum]|uniref:Transposase (putative) gypsy type domain-containing protein n=1 Tax=Lolium multiflorum TaxID=4521 RepID=A0AAD8SEL0_LOLMU|nr:hypothetical protein QYE76_068512 [Lolium multiflorum]